MYCVKGPVHPNSSVLIDIQRRSHQPSFTQGMTREVLLAKHVCILVAEASELRQGVAALFGQHDHYGCTSNHWLQERSWSHACDADAKNHVQEEHAMVSFVGGGASGYSTSRWRGLLRTTWFFSQGQSRQAK
jgi:hypothetical protein